MDENIYEAPLLPPIHNEQEAAPPPQGRNSHDDDGSASRSSRSGSRHGEDRDGGAGGSAHGSAQGSARGGGGATKRLHIGGLSREITELDLRALFADYIPVISELWVARNPFGFAFVTLPADQADTFTQRFANANVRGRALTIMEAQSSGRKEFISGGGGRGRGSVRGMMFGSLTNRGGMSVAVGGRGHGGAEKRGRDDDRGGRDDKYSRRREDKHDRRRDDHRDRRVDKYRDDRRRDDSRDRRRRDDSRDRRRDDSRDRRRDDSRDRRRRDDSRDRRRDRRRDDSRDDSRGRRDRRDDRHDRRRDERKGGSRDKAFEWAQAQAQVPAFSGPPGYPQQQYPPAAAQNYGFTMM